MSAAPGAPLPGLSVDDLDRFHEGRAIFSRPFTPEEGLGPLFNQDRCSSCHDLPTIGGAGEEVATKAARFDPPDRCDLLRHEGGDNVQQRATPLLMSHGIDREGNPPSATARVSVTAPALFGLGLMEAIPAETIERRADPDDLDGDGISGKIGTTDDGRPGRFGRKAEFATVADFIDTALRFEMGLTTPSNPQEETVNGVPVPEGTDPVPDPEVDERAVELLTDFVRFLAPAAPLAPSSAAVRDTVARGERVFQDLGCGSCHVPSMQTGPSENPALDEKAIRLYSDLLLHDLGPEIAGVCGVGATPSEFRTSPLIGLRFRPFFLHDGRGNSLWGAIMQHRGEATAAQDAFAHLGRGAQESLFRFLLSL